MMSGKIDMILDFGDFILVKLRLKSNVECWRRLENRGKVKVGDTISWKMFRGYSSSGECIGYCKPANHLIIPPEYLEG